jgi:hypothetical protein
MCDPTFGGGVGIFRLRGELVSPLGTDPNIETPRLPAGSAGGAAGLGDLADDTVFWEMARVLVGAAGVGAGGGSTLRRGGGVADTGGGSLSDAALGRAGGRGGAGGADGLGEASLFPCILRGGRGTMREGAEETGRAGGGGGGALPGKIGGPAVFRAGTAGGTAAPRGGAGGTTIGDDTGDD